MSKGLNRSIKHLIRVCTNKVKLELNYRRILNDRFILYFGPIYYTSPLSVDFLSRGLRPNVLSKRTA